MSKPAILIMLHCAQSTGYAIAKLEAVFEKAAHEAGYSESEIYWSFCSVTVPSPMIFEINYYSSRSVGLLRDLIAKKSISTILAFDLPFPSDVALVARRRGVTRVVSYWGASMSDLNWGFKLLLKRIEFLFSKKKAAHMYVFESFAMQETAVKGRGLPDGQTTVIPLGVDLTEYCPRFSSNYVYGALDIPENRRIVFYSGHMEERKGVSVIIDAAIELAKLNEIENVHFVLCGNKPGEEDRYVEMLRDTSANNHVTFAGYRNDLPELMASSFVGVIASTGWDSLTRSGVEMLACGLPLLVSRLGGLPELIEDGQSGFSFDPGDSVGLSRLIIKMGNPSLRARLSANARKRAELHFSEKRQILALSDLLRQKSR